MVRSAHQRPNRCHRIFWDLSLVRNQATARHSQRREGTGRFTPLDIHLYFNLSPFHRKKNVRPFRRRACHDEWGHVSGELTSSSTCRALLTAHQVSWKKIFFFKSALFLYINRRRLRQQEEKKNICGRRFLSFHFEIKVEISLIKSKFC